MPKNKNSTDDQQGDVDNSGEASQSVDNLPKTQDELEGFRNRILAPKLSRIAELEGQVNDLTSERDQLSHTVSSHQDSISQLTADADASKRALLVKDVAHSKGVPEKYIHGDSKEELEASADEFLSDVATLSAPNTGAESRGDEVVRSAGTGDETPPKPSYKERLEEAYTKALSGQKGVTI